MKIIQVQKYFQIILLGLDASNVGANKFPQLAPTILMGRKVGSKLLAGQNDLITGRIITRRGGEYSKFDLRLAKEFWFVNKIHIKYLNTDVLQMVSILQNE